MWLNDFIFKTIIYYKLILFQNMRNSILLYTEQKEIIWKLYIIKGDKERMIDQ